MVNFCPLCDNLRVLETHHIYAGQGRRKKSDKYGAVIQVCHECHMAIHEHPKEYEYIKRNTQIVLMHKNNWDKEDFIREFGKSYL